MKYFLIAGEPSGDLHGAQLIKAIQAVQSDAVFVGHGGDKMAKTGMRIIEHVDQLSIMGFTEVLKHLPRMLKIMGQTVEAIQRYKPDRVILIDYPGFNLRLAKNIHHLKIPITYFILPQVWAWKENRIKTIKKYVDQSLCIFPFEQAWFESRGISANYIGHPFVDRPPLSIKKEDYFASHGLNPKQPLLVLLPGSRKQEINRHWPIFLETVTLLKKQKPEYQFILGKSPHVTIEPCPDFIKIEKDARFAMTHGSAAITASGTATLECAVEDIPLIVCYKLSRVSWWITRWATKVKYISMVNLILNRMLVPELLQKEMTADRLSSAIIPLLESKSAVRKKMLNGFNEVRRSLGLPGVYERAAKAIAER
jgi:lipid-A-disaccharide synthase